MQKCILIYDDDEEIQTLIKIILEKKNYRTETRSSCDTILEDVNGIKPSLVLMDLWIPILGGEVALKQMKGNEATRNVPVFLLSAHDSIVEISEKLNADGYLKKPFTIDTLIQLVEHNISEKK